MQWVCFLSSSPVPRNSPFLCLGIWKRRQGPRTFIYQVS